MSGLKLKADNNIVAAELLNKNEHRLYSSSVHCSYYSCFQLIKYILLKHIFKTEGEYENEEYKSQKSSHEFAINRLTIDFAKRNQSALRNLNNDIIQLKELRVQSDYKINIIELQLSQKAFDLANRVRNILGKSYKL